MLLQITFFISTALTLIQSQTTIESDPVTNWGWGYWGPMDMCPDGSFVKAILVKYEGDQGAADDTALNAIHLSCVPLEDQVTINTFNVTKILMSSEGPYGNWAGRQYCFRGLAIGFKLRSEGSLGIGDDTAANDMVLLCASSAGVNLTTSTGMTFGSWRSEKRCPPRMAVCGLQTQLDPNEGTGFFGGDDTTLNNVRLSCCDLPSPAATCSPSDVWMPISVKDNTKGTTSMTDKYTKTTGIENTSTHSDYTSVLDEVAVTVGFGINAEFFKVLGANFEAKLSTSTKTQHSWTQTDTTVLTEITEESIELVIPVGCATTISQLVGKCGPYTVKTNNIKREDACGAYFLTCAVTMYPLIVVVVALNSIL